MMPFKTQNQLSKIMTLPVAKIFFVNRRSKPTVFHNPSNSLSISAWESFPSTSSSPYRTPDLPHAMVWYSFPKGWGFRGTKVHPGQVHLLVQGDILSSRHETHDGEKNSFILRFHSLSNWRICQNLSLYCGFVLLVYVKERRISSNLERDIYSCRRNGATSNLLGSVSSNQARILQPTLAVDMRKSNPINLRSSGRSTGLCSFLFVSGISTS